MSHQKGLNTILRSDKTVFSFREILILWGETNASSVPAMATAGINANANAKLAKAKINYYVKTGRLYPIRKGIYAKDKNYEKLEFAGKIFKPSYISLETVLALEGLIPGPHENQKSIFALTYQTRHVLCDRQNYEFKKIKNSVLTNPLGITQKNNCIIASKERALLDTLYLCKNYHFDNLNSVDWEKCFDMVYIYKNKNLEKRLYSIYESFKYT